MTKTEMKDFFKNVGQDLAFHEFKQKIRERQSPVVRDRYYYYSKYGQYCNFWRENENN